MTPSPAAVVSKWPPMKTYERQSTMLRRPPGCVSRNLATKPKPAGHIEGRRITWFMSPSSLTGSPL